MVSTAGPPACYGVPCLVVKYLLFFLLNPEPSLISVAFVVKKKYSVAAVYSQNKICVNVVILAQAGTVESVAKYLLFFGWLLATKLDKTAFKPSLNITKSVETVS
ncbi:MAG: hypothetical protein Q7T18_06115 [Sedimentisphaerales bacterium]|nr:hypothetical protein [Sedimentisphaerales bacterium]